MRKSILLPLLALACSGDDAPDPGFRLIPDFLARTRPLACVPLDAPDLAVERMHTASDTSVMVLDAAQQRITELTDRMTTVWSLEYQEHGPAAIQRPVDAAPLGDSGVAVVARGPLRLVLLHRDGRLIHTEPLAFIPNAVTQTAAGDLLVTAMPIGPSPEQLLFRFDGEDLLPINVPPRPFPDMTVGALGNATLVAGLSDGAALVVHQFFAPRAFRVLPGIGAVTPVPVPTPDATRDRIDFVPRPPVTADQFSRMLTPALAMTVDPRRGEVFLLTRSGRTLGGRPERAVLRLDTDLAPQTSYVLSVHAVHMAALPGRQALILVDDEDRFHRCAIHAPADGP